MRHGIRADIKFEITNILYVEIILDFDLFEQTKVIVDNARKNINIPGKTIILILGFWKLSKMFLS